MGCIEWEGCVVKGYGQIRVGKKTRYIHVVTWENERGELSPGFEVHHRCGNKLCYNIEHLEAMHWMDHKQVHIKAKCKYGHDREWRPGEQRWRCPTCMKKHARDSYKRGTSGVS